MSTRTDQSLAALCSVRAMLLQFAVYDDDHLCVDIMTREYYALFEGD